MRELRLTDAELQGLIAPALRGRLVREGFRLGASEGEGATYGVLMFPVNLDLAGMVTVERTEEGVWIFQQQERVVFDRFADSFVLHCHAIDGRDRPPE